jgi:hypothetical protein
MLDKAEDFGQWAVEVFFRTLMRILGLSHMVQESESISLLKFRLKLGNWFLCDAWLMNKSYYQLFDMSQGFGFLQTTYTQCGYKCCWNGPTNLNYIGRLAFSRTIYTILLKLKLYRKSKLLSTKACIIQIKSFTFPKPFP